MKYRLFGILMFLLFVAWRTLDGLVEGDWGRLEGGMSNLVVLRLVPIQCVKKMLNSFALLVTWE